MREQEAWVERTIKAEFEPLPSDTDVSLLHALELSRYPAWRKVELWNAYQSTMDESAFINESFVKREFYEVYKYPRCINSRTDRFKAHTMGPIHAMELSLVKQCEWLIKSVPVRDRPTRILDRCSYEGLRPQESDHTAFEAHMTEEVMRVNEFQVYDYMLKEVEDSETVMGYMRRALLDDQECIFSNCRVKCPAARMSGDLVTSIGNGLTNMFAARFLVEGDGRFIGGVVEGDDGLFVVDGPLPTSQDYASLGFNVKLQERESVGDATFCSMVFDETELENMADPIELICRFGWSFSQRRNGGPRIRQGLLRAKALSLLYAYPACPIVRELGLYGLRATEGWKAIWERDYWNEQIFQGLATGWENILSTELLPRVKKPISPRSRALVSSHFNVPACTQIEIETYLQSLHSVQPLNCVAINRMVSSDWLHNWDEHVARY
jgi:hypothetical protein